MVSASDIRDQIAQFISKRIDLDTFEDWIVRETWNIHTSGSKAAEILAFAVEDSLSEYSFGHLTEGELRSEVESLLESDNITVYVYRLPQRAWFDRLPWTATISSPTAQVHLARP